MPRNNRVSLRTNIDDERAATTNKSVDVDDEKEAEGFFGRLFSPGTVDTSVSEESRGEYDSEFDDDSAESGTFGTDVSGDSKYDDSDESSGASSTGSSIVRFDKELRAKHRAACKSMTVSFLLDLS